MTDLRIPTGSDPGTYKQEGSAKVLNAYAEAGGASRKSAYTITPVAGMKTFGSYSGGACRGLLYVEDDDVIYAVRGGQIHKFEEDATSTLLGYVEGTQSLSIARNDNDNQQVVIVSDNYAYQLQNEQLDQLSYGDYLTPAGVTYCNGYFVFWQGDGRFFASELQSTEVTALNFATAEGDPDGLTAAFGMVKTLYLVGRRTIEVWAINPNAGDGFPFQPIGGAHLSIGCISPHSVVEFDQSMAFVGEDNVVYMVRGYQEAAISNDEVSELIEADTNKAGITATTYNRGRNKFLMLQGTDWTREFNLATNEWHNRESIYGGPWHCVHYARAWGRDFFGDTKLGQIFEADYTIHTDDGDAQVWGFDTQIFHAFPNGLSFERVDLDMETGDGISLTEDAKLMVSWSDDNGRTWSAERRPSLGKTGEYSTRARLQRLGQCGGKGRMFRVRISDPVIRSITSMSPIVEPVEL